MIPTPPFRHAQFIALVRLASHLNNTGSSRPCKVRLHRLRRAMSPKSSSSRIASSISAGSNSIGDEGVAIAAAL